MLVARVVAIVIVLGLVAGAAYLALEETDDSEQAAGEIYLEASDAPGPNPFMPSVATIDEAATTITPSSSDAPTTTADSQTGIDTGRAVGALLLSLIDAETPGLYGGTRDETSCNVLQMAAFLDGDDAKRAAWAQVQGIATDAVNAYLRELTPVNLRVDTRVTNHGFSNGTATPRNAILQAGTAVLVDELGVPRAKCGCGNPLTPPTEVQGTPAFQGQPWPTFDPHDVKVVQPAPAPVDEFVLVDPGGAPFARPAATTGADDQDAPPEMLQTVTTALDPPPPPPTTTGGGDIGTPTTPRAVSASTVYSDEFPASLAVDGDPTTSWFSAGPGADGTTTFTWEAPAPGRVIGVQIVSNAQHENPEFRTGFGFESVEVQILDESGEVVFSNPVALPGTPDPLITIRPDFEGAAVRLVFGGHEDPACGGIADLFVVMG